MRALSIALCGWLAGVAGAAQESVRFEAAQWRPGDVWLEHRELFASWQTGLSVEGTALFDFAEPELKVIDEWEWEIEILECDAQGPVRWYLRMPYTPLGGRRIAMQRTDSPSARIDDITGVDVRTRIELEAMAREGFPAGMPQHPFAALLAGRTIAIDESIQVEPEIADRLFPQSARTEAKAATDPVSNGGGWKTDSMRMRLVGVERSRGEDCGRFEVSMRCSLRGLQGAAMHSELSGVALFTLRQCALEDLQLQGPVDIGVDASPVPMRIVGNAQIRYSYALTLKTSRWMGAAHRDWNEVKAWSPGEVPDEPDEVALIETAGPSDVFLAQPLHLNALRLLSPDAVLHLSGSSITLDGETGLENRGSLQLEPGADVTWETSFTNHSGARLDLTRGSVRLTFRALKGQRRRWINDGIVAIGGTNASSAALRFDANVEILGTGEIRLDHPHQAVVDTVSDAPVFQSATHSLRGSGEVRAALFNHGNVEATGTGAVLRLVDRDKWNRGTLRARAGAVLEISGITVDNEAGQIVADGGEIWFGTGGALAGEVDSLTINGGWLRSRGSSSLTVQPGTTLRLIDVRNESRLRITESSARVTVYGNLHNDGKIEVFQQGAASAELHLEAGTEDSRETRLEGSGSIELNQEAAALLSADAQVRVIQGPGHLLRGSGYCVLSLENRGTLRADDPRGMTIVVQHHGFTNVGRIEVLPAVTLRVRDGELAQLDGGTLRVDGTLVLDRSLLGLAGGVLSGHGRIEGNVIHSSGRIEVDRAGLHILGDYRQKEDAVLSVDVSDSTAADPRTCLKVDGQAELSGTLVLQIQGPFPKLDEPLVLIRADGELTVRFRSVEWPTGITGMIEYTAHEVLLRIDG